MPDRPLEQDGLREDETPIKIKLFFPNLCHNVFLEPYTTFSRNSSNNQKYRNMKKFMLVLIASIPLVANAQGVYFKLDAGLGGALTFGDFKSYGIAAFTEPKVFIIPSVSAGLRLEGDVLFGGTISDQAEDLNVGLSTRAVILLKGEFYVGQSNTRPFVGLGLGRYTIANTSASGTGSASISAGNHFGLAPEIGVTFGNFRLSGMYHIVTGENLVTLSTGGTKEVSLNYFVIQIGFKIFSVGE